MADVHAEPTLGPLAHQFDDLKQQHDADELGMWLFLSTEIMFFGGLFLAYTIYRTQDEATFAAASHQLDLAAGHGQHRCAVMQQPDDGSRSVGGRKLPASKAHGSARGHDDSRLCLPWHQGNRVLPQV